MGPDGSIRGWSVIDIGVWCSNNLQVDSQTDSSETGTLYVHSLALQTPTCDVPRDGGGVFLFCFGCCIFLDEVLRYVDETFFVFQTYLKMMDTKKGWLEGAKLLNKTVGFSSQICETSSLFVEGGFFFEAFLETRQTFPKKKIGTRWVGALISERIDFKNPWIVRVNYVYYGELYSSTSFVWGIRELYSSTFIYD